MFRLFVLSLICWLVFGASHLKANVRFSVIVNDTRCALALTEFRKPKSFEGIVSGSVAFDASNDDTAELFVFLWNRNLTNQNIFRDLIK